MAETAEAGSIGSALQTLLKRQRKLHFKIEVLGGVASYPERLGHTAAAEDVTKLRSEFLL